MVLFVIYVSCFLCYAVLSVPCNLVINRCERTDLLDLWYVMFSCVFVTFSICFPWSGIALPDLCLHFYFVYARIDGSGETVCMRRLA